MTDDATPPGGVVQPPRSGGVLTRDPVRIVWVCYGLAQGIVIALMAGEVVGPKTSAVVTGIALAIYVAVSELFVHRETVPTHNEPALKAALDERIRERSG